MRTFHRLRDAGFTEAEALAQIADFLKQVEKAHKQLGTPIDENTQRMIDQARAAGLMGDEAVSATEQQRRGFEMVTKAINQLIVTLGGVPVAIDDISKALDDIPKDVEINVDLKMPDHLPELPPGPVYFPPGQRPTEIPELPEPPDGWDRWHQTVTGITDDLDEQGEVATSAASDMTRAYRNVGEPIDANTQLVIDQAREVIAMGADTAEATAEQSRGFEMVTSAIGDLIVALDGVPTRIEQIGEAIRQHLPTDIIIPIDFELPDGPQYFPEPPVIEEAPFPQFPQGPYYPGPMGPGGFTPEDVDAAMRAGAQRTDNGMIYIEVPVEIDGEAVTRVVARRLPEHTELYGGPSARTTI